MSSALGAAARGIKGAGWPHAYHFTEEMMRHCQMMEQHQAQGGHDPAEHDPAQHGGMTHEQMMQHCAEMRAHGAQPQH